MLLQRFWNLIDESSIGRFAARKEEQIEQLDPQRIYVENVRSFFGIPYRAAHFLCELAVRERVLARRFGILCPQCQRILTSVDSEADVPVHLTCEVCERNECERYAFDSNELRALLFYKLIA